MPSFSVEGTGRVISAPETMEFWRGQHGRTSQKATSLPHAEFHSGAG